MLSYCGVVALPVFSFFHMDVNNRLRNLDRIFQNPCPTQKSKQAGETLTFTSSDCTWLVYIICAFVFIVVCIALDRSNTVAFQYGGIKGCWINNRHASLYFFVLPVALSLSFNSVFFALTVRAIRRTKEQTQRATHQTQKRQTAAVFLKIFILMGFTWIFGFLKVLVSDYSEYPFVIFTTLQGLYVVLAFVFTARVKQMYCQLFYKNNSVTRQERTPQPKTELTAPVVLLSHIKKNEE